MNIQTQIFITSICILGLAIMFVATFRSMRKQEKAWDLKQKENDQENMHYQNHSKQKRHNKVEVHIEMDKILYFKMPGPRSGVRCWNCEDIVRKYLQKKRISYRKFAITSRQYTEYKGPEKRKKAQGYWEFNIIYG